MEKRLSLSVHTPLVERGLGALTVSVGVLGRLLSKHLSCGIKEATRRYHVVPA